MGESIAALIARKGLRVGHYVGEFTTSGIGHILKQAGAEFVFLDMEHSGYSHETVKSCLRYFEAADLPAMVRVPSDAYHHIARALDVGAQAIVIPMVGSGEQAASIVQKMKYTPIGKRGVALGGANDRYREAPVKEALAAANERNRLVCLIETVDGIANVDAIAATEGVDVLWLGHFDLSCSMGIPAEFDHPDYIAAVAKVREAALRHGKALGSLVADVETGLSQARNDWDLIAYQSDIGLYREALRNGIASLRSRFAQS